MRTGTIRPRCAWARAGEGAGEAAAVAGITRPLIVTDRGLVKLPMIKAASDILVGAKRPVQVFSDVKPNPGAATIEAGLEALRGGKHDGVIAIGGGSALDAGKVIAFMAGQTRPMWDFEDIGDWWTRADPKGIFPSSRFRPRRAPAPRSAAPASSPTRRRIPRR